MTVGHVAKRLFWAALAFCLVGRLFPLVVALVYDSGPLIGAFYPVASVLYVLGLIVDACLIALSIAAIPFGAESTDLNRQWTVYGICGFIFAVVGLFTLAGVFCPISAICLSSVTRPVPWSKKRGNGSEIEAPGEAFSKDKKEYRGPEF